MALLRVLNEFFSTWRFPVFTVSSLGFLAALLLFILLVPPGPDALGAFAEDFKIWCFGYDPATGELEWGYVAIFLLQPAVLALITAAIWSDTFREALARPRQALPYGLAGMAVVGVSAVALAAVQPPTTPDGQLPFPAEALRTEMRAPEVVLVDHTGAPVRTSDYAGRVLMVTAVFASCGDTCPKILAEVERALAELDPELRDDVAVVAISLDPSHDTPEVLAALAATHGVAAPQHRFATGDPAVVRQALADFGFAWSRDPETGLLEHANLFVLVDRDGRIAYRLALGDRQQRWLADALKTLARESDG